MINCAFLIFQNCKNCIKELIQFYSSCFFPLIYIHALKTKRTAIPIERNIGVIFFKPVQIIGCWTDTDYFMNGNICILEWITDIKNPCSESMRIRDINVNSEGFSMCHWTVGLIKINTLNMRISICSVFCNKFPCIRTVALLITLINDWTEDLCSSREEFYWYGSWKKAENFVIVVFHKWSFFP